MSTTPTATRDDEIPNFAGATKNTEGARAGSSEGVHLVGNAVLDERGDGAAGGSDC